MLAGFIAGADTSAAGAEEKCGIADPDFIAVADVDGLNVDDCGLESTIVVSGDVAAEIPSPGTGVIALGITEDGGAYLELAVATDGTISASSQPPAIDRDPLDPLEGEPEPQVAQALAAYSRCTDYSRSLSAGYWRPGILYLNSNDRRPSNITKATFESITTASMNVWKNRTNSCGMNNAVDVPGSISYGNWTYDSNISSTNACTTRDSRNVIDFGALSGSTLGLTCTWFNSAGSPIEADVRIDTSSRSWVTTATGCTGSKYDLRSVVTHELGHVLRIGHADEHGGSDLTMSPNISPCNTSARTLGAGDVTALYL
ncbi:matrixin family metalloprotease, partial [Microbacterium sp.]|uniref:matrixin family metalloprotease n=1 Tax=Microbacterium sp. TaxID=51671 RepID=UPI003A891FB2